jgi:hypothetical protein
MFYAKICTGGARLTLGTFATMEQAARAYDAAAWRLGRHASSSISSRRRKPAGDHRRNR